MRDTTRKSSIIGITVLFLPFLALALITGRPLLAVIIGLGWCLSIVLYLIARWWYET